MKNPLYTISNFSVRYPFSTNQINIIGDVVINASDVVLITGRSGSGKSSLLYALKGLFPDVIVADISGVILFKGMPVNLLSKTEKLKIGLVLQNPDSQMINRLVVDELAFGLENLQLPAETIKDKIAKLIKKFNLGYLSTREVNSLSGGEKQKVALLSVILTDPEVILLDEPTAFLDPISALDFMHFLHEIRQDKTIIIIEHNTHYVADIVNRCFMIESNGELHEIDYRLHTNTATTSLQSLSIKLKDYRALSFFASKPNDLLLLRVKNLSYNYIGHKKIIDNLSFSVNKADILGIIGKSGSGKSTLLKLLARLVKTKNSIYLYGKDIRHYSNKEFYSQLGLLFQNPENHFLFDTVAKELNDNDEILSLFELEKVREQNPFTLSEGQKRRLSMGVLNSTFHDRSLYLLDEPSFGQDETNKDKIIRLIKKMQYHGKSFIIVSHDYSFIDSVCNRVVVLDV